MNSLFRKIIKIGMISISVLGLAACNQVTANASEVESITVPVDSLEVPEEFNEDWLLTNTYPGDAVLSDDAFSGLVDDEFSHSTLIVLLNENVSDDDKTTFLSKYNAELVYDYEIICGMAIKLSEDKTTEELDALIAEMEKEDIVISVQKDYIMHTNDSLLEGEISLY